jgi:Leucine-rich repeat (LRR) protein
MHHQVEHQTGLIILPNDDTKGLAPAVVKALRGLRDNNPSLHRKLNLDILDSSSNDSSTASSPVDESLSYWNRYQELVIVSADDSSNYEFVGVNFGGLMVRLVNVVPFFQIVEEEKFSCLQTLNFGGTDIGMENLLQGIQLLSDITKSSIQGLYLGGCGIGCRKGANHLSKLLRLLPNLKTLDLRYNDLVGGNLVDLESVLSSYALSQLKILHLEGNMIKCEGAAAIGRILASTNSNLQELYLGANQIGSEGIRSLAEVGLRKNTNLNKLYLEGNCIGDVGAIALRDVLLDQLNRQCKVLEQLYVDNNGLGKEAATSLGRAVHSDTMIDGSLFDS